MLHNLCIVHRRKPHVFAVGQAPVGQVPVWATCLRSLAFVADPSEVDLHPQDEVYTRAEAYRFLLEIVCGMHSPIVGETEVFGQFKIFMGEWLKLQPHHTVLAQRILSDAKMIRAQHLAGLGNQSYGSWLRKNVKATRVHILGGGQLVREVLPYLAKQGKQVTVHVRDPRKVDFHADVTSIDRQAFTGGALVIAAPMSASEIESWIGGTHPSQIFDLRDNSCTDRVRREGDHHGLRAIFDQIEQNKKSLLPVIERVKLEILARAHKVAAQALVRPQGWDDLCA